MEKLTETTVENDLMGLAWETEMLLIEYLDTGYLFLLEIEDKYGSDNDYVKREKQKHERNKQKYRKIVKKYKSPF